MRRAVRSLVSAAGLPALFLMLASCGGGSTPPPPPANRAPVFSSATALSVPESQTGTIYTATASDADANALTFSLSGGTDAALLQITGAGALSFRAPPDFEAPADADRNNIYLVTIAVSDGTASVTLDLAITITDTTTGAFRVRRVGTGFNQPLFLAGLPDTSGRVLVVEKEGQIRVLTPASGAISATPFLDLSAQIATDSERGLLGLALAPDFATSGTIYVNVNNLAGDTEIRRYRTLPGNPDRIDPASGDVILTFAQPFGNHKGGWIDFGADGLLYIASGDGGGGGDPFNNGQNRNILLGKMLRIDVSRDAFPADAARDYAIPTGNPFAASGGAPEIWALGLRNPFRNSFDRVTGNLWIADVGQALREEVNLMRPGDGGANFGWALFEGNLPMKGTDRTGLTFPVTEYEHGNGPVQGDSITGGYVYRGPVESLQGQYIFGDFVRGAIWSVPIGQLVPGASFASSGYTVRTQSFAPNAGAIGNISSFGQDRANNLYIVDFDGEIFVIEPA